MKPSDRVTRREFIAGAAALGAGVAWCRGSRSESRSPWVEQRGMYPQGVASGDPDWHSVLLWTRRPFAAGTFREMLNVEVAEDPAFKRVVASTAAECVAESDWTCRVLVGGLKPDHEYFYRFSDTRGLGSRVGRTRTAPRVDDARTARFAFVSCQNVNYGAQNAWRRMIWEDERAAEAERLDFVLHLGDFIYELVWYPQDRPQGMYDRRIREILRYPDGEKIDDFHVPTTTQDYRAVYRAYLDDPDIQDARARWPFVTMWDNHEFSWLGWQGIQKFDGTSRPAQRRKVSANQAWFEYQPARVRKPSNSLTRFDPPNVVDAPVTRFDAQGLGTESNNLAAIGSLTGYRALRWGAHVDVIITDQHSYRSEEPTDRAEAKGFNNPAFPEFFPEEAQQILDAGRAWNQGRPPASIAYGNGEMANFRRSEPPQTILGLEQKHWLRRRLKQSQATWKIWANTAATLDMRADPQHLPEEFHPRWPGAGYAGFGGGDPSTAYVERAEMYDFIAHENIAGFAIVAGDRHSFWAGYAAKALPPQAFEPVGIAFVTGSLSAPGMIEAMEHGFPKTHPLRPLFLADRPDGRVDATVNLMLKHGVRSALSYAADGDAARARMVANADNAPHVAFVDMGGHGYSIVRASADTFETEFVCIPRPLERSATPDGGPLRYRVLHRSRLWKAGAKPTLETHILEGDPGLGI